MSYLIPRLADAVADTVALMVYERMTAEAALAAIGERYTLTADEVVAVRVTARDAYEAHE